MSFWPQPRPLAGFSPAGKALRFFLGLIVFSFFLLGHTDSTLIPQYAAIFVGAVGYALVSRGSLPGSLYYYLMTRHMALRWWLILWMVASLMWSVNLQLAAIRIASTILIYAVSLVVFDAVRVYGETRFVIKSVFFAAAACALITVVSILKIPVFDRPASIFGNPNIIALISLLGLVVYTFHDHGYRHRLLQWIWHLLGAALFLSTFMSSSRKGLLGVAILVVLAMYRRASRRRLMVVAMIAVPLVVVGVSASNLLNMRSRLTFSHLETITQVGGGSMDSDRSFSERAIYLATGLERFQESPLIGHGLEAFRSFVGVDTYSHNNYIEMAVSLGLVGLLLYYAFYVQLLMACYNRRRGMQESMTYIAFLLMALVLDVGFVSYLFKPWILFPVLVAGNLARGRQDAPVPSVSAQAPNRSEESR